VLLATMMLPAQVLLIPHFLAIQVAGLGQHYKPLIVPSWLGGGAFFIFLLRQFFKGVPKELRRPPCWTGPALADLHLIMLPLARPALATVAVLSFIATGRSSWSADLSVRLPEIPGLAGPSDVPVGRGSWPTC